ncbi:MAG: tRNA (adenosine(37)-N6)-dimethylallyltransferase MiaA [Saprospiraceae bacterium]|nr:tRNA (adenosine(37)-N6)-dimethylallyltransferase MiaA [Saprospiraceae bacterium]
MKQKHLIVIGGATASGKTAFAIRTALNFNTEIISADSRQFYREMNIGTAKPSAEELARVKHHFIGHLSIHEPYSVGDFERDALALLEQLFQQYDRVVMAGGSGLFVKAVCEGLDAFPEVPEAIRAGVMEFFENRGLAALQEELRQSDPVYFAEVDINNPSRLIRAVSVCRASGRPFSSFRRQVATPRFFEPVYVRMDWPRAELYRRIDQRVDDMMRRGLLEEARALYPFRHLPALQTVGYQELFDYFDRKINLEEAVRLIRQHTRNYAKRQLTWMRRYGQWESVAEGRFEDWKQSTLFVG